MSSGTLNIAQPSLLTHALPRIGSPQLFLTMKIQKLY